MSFLRKLFLRGMERLGGVVSDPLIMQVGVLNGALNQIGFKEQAYSLGRMCGVRITEDITAKITKPPTFEEWVKAIPLAIMHFTGRRSDASVVSSDEEGGTITVKVKNSIYCRMPRGLVGADTPQCSFLAGLLAGSTSTILSDLYVGEETECDAMTNKGYCLVSVRRSG